MNGTTNFSWGTLATTGGVIPTYSNGTCSNYCHGATLSGGTDKTPSWNQTNYLPATLTPAACATCHGFPPSTSAHTNLQTPTGFPTSSCGCHPNLRSTGTTYADIFVDKSIHIDGKLDGGGECDSCHGYPPANKRFVASTGNWQFAKMENYTGGGGAHTVAGHVKAGANKSEQFTNCTPCHNASDHVMSPLVFNPSSNIKVRVDSRLRFANATLGKYSSNKKDGAQHVSGRCSSVACHFQKTPKW
jgi:hypothetical protein